MNTRERFKKKCLWLKKKLLLPFLLFFHISLNTLIYFHLNKLILFFLWPMLCIHPCFIYSFDDVLKSSMSCRLQVMSMSTCGIKTQGPNRRHLWGTSQEPSEGQVSEWEISKNSIVRELEIFCILEKRGGLMFI